MIVTYWGVRGSLPVPGPSTVRFGGNTSCVTVEVEGNMLVLDAGTGIRALGASLGPDQRRIAVLLSHRHADHVQGLPFFAPLFDSDREVHLLDFPSRAGAWPLLDMFDGLYVSVVPSSLARGVHRVGSGATELLADWGIRVQSLALHHPGGAFGFRIESGGRAFVYMTDNELTEVDDAFFDRCVHFCRGADVLSHDAQYLQREMAQRRGWGHSSAERVCDLASAAGVGRLVLFHHDPDRSDAEVEVVEESARVRLQPHGIGCDAAYEGMRIEL